MNDKARPAQGMIRIDYQRLGHFIVRLFAGITLLNIWALLAVATIIALIYVFDLVSGFDGFVYVAGVLFIPVAFFCWWICSILTLEFFAEIGIELHGVARFLVVPVAIPIAALSFLISLWSSVGEVINNRAILAICFIAGVALVVWNVMLFL